ncbi:ATP synthase subunit I [Marinomonas epiphytica]
MQVGHSKPLSSSLLLRAKKRAVFGFIFLQSLLLIVVTLGIWLFSTTTNAYSFLLGGGVSVIPSIYMAWRVFGHKGARPARDVVKSFYRGEAGKLVLTAVLLSLVFVYIKPLTAGYFFAGFGFVILSHWLSPILLKR